MSIKLKALQADVLRISDIYAREHGIERSADVLGMLLIYCQVSGVDIEQAMRRKWLHWLEKTP